jgi:hypothetical protein
MRHWLLLPLRLLKGLIGWVLALVILFEQWGWEPLQRLQARFGRWPPLRWFEIAVRGLPPYGALALFALPTPLLLPVKLGALWLIGPGQVVAGAMVIVTAKLVGTAIVARLFTLTQPALMRLPWFEQLHGRWTRWKHVLLDRHGGGWDGGDDGLCSVNNPEFIAIHDHFTLGTACFDR